VSRRRRSTRLLAATLLSVAAHAALLAGSWLTPPEAVPVPPTLTARLEPLAPPSSPPPPATKPAIRPRPAATPPRQIAVAPRVAPPPESFTVPAAAAGAGEPAPDMTAESAAEPAVVASAAPTIFRMPEAPPLPEFPRRGTITYLLTMGPDQTPVGRTVQTWEFDGNQYRLGSQSESTGLIEMFRPHRYRYVSEGTVSDRGLRPERFLASVRRGSRTEESLAVFNWDEHSVRLGRLPQQATVALPDGTQDMISFIFHFALAPPAPGRMQIPFTRGTRLATASFDVLPHEMIDTPLGRLRTVPVVQVREPGSESLAVWLATDYRNLPVRIRFYNRDGEAAGEQLVSEIRVSDQ
jgi:Protein of unknown function (DUF3108)